MRNITVDYKLGVVEMPLSDADFERLVELTEVGPDGSMVAQMTLENYPCAPIQGIETLVHIHAAGVLMVKDFELHWTHSDWQMDADFDRSALEAMELEEKVDYLTDHSDRSPDEFEVYNLFDLTITTDSGSRIEIRF